MPYKPKMNNGVDMVRLEARIPKDVHAFMNEYARVNKVKSVGQVIERVAEDAVKLGFVRSYKVAMKRPDDLAEVLLQHQNSVLSQLREKYAGDAVESRLLDEAEELLMATPRKRRQKKCLVDTQINEGSKANKLFTTLYQDFGHRASRPKVLSSMVRFVRSNQTEESE